MAAEPRGRKAHHVVEGSGLLEQMRRIGHDVELLVAAQAQHRLLVERDDLRVEAADDEQCRRSDILECGTGQVRPAAARHHGRGAVLRRARRHQRCAAAGAGAEVADRQRGRVGLQLRPGGGFAEAAGEQLDVEHVGAVALFMRRQQVEQQGRDAGLAQRLGDMLIAWTQAPAAAAVGEDHEADRLRRNAE